MATVASQLIRERRNRQAIARWKAERGCADCGESDPIVLELHHADNATKIRVKKHQRSAVQPNWTWARILKALEDCTVLCANCHRRHTAREQNWEVSTVGAEAH